MTTLKWMLYKEILQKVGFVTLGFLGLFFFFDTIDELKNVGQGPDRAYTLELAMTFVFLMVPQHLYELLPITVLIGTIDRKSTRLNSSHIPLSRMPSSA